MGGTGVSGGLAGIAGAGVSGGMDCVAGAGVSGGLAGVADVPAYGLTEVKPTVRTGAGREGCGTDRNFVIQIAMNGVAVSTCLGDLEHRVLCVSF